MVKSLEKVRFMIKFLIFFNLLFQSIAISAWRGPVMTTQFFIGEPGSGGSTAWDVSAVKSMGGVDYPLKQRNFTPKQNTFYIALPYSDIDSLGRPRPQRPPFGQEQIPKVKNLWVAIKYKNNICYAQWVDCGPVDKAHPECDDYDYVFGSSNPQHHGNIGLDISPDVSKCLGMRDPKNQVHGHLNDNTYWQFVAFDLVPPGPWKKVINTSGLNWK